MSDGEVSSHFVHSLLRAQDWQHRPQFDDVCKWWRDGGRGVFALVGVGGAGKTAIAERFLRVLPGVFPPSELIPVRADLSEPWRMFVFSFYDAPNPDSFFSGLFKFLPPSGDSSSESRPASYHDCLLALQRSEPILLVLDGLETVQDDGVRGGIFGDLTDRRLTDLLVQVADGYVPRASVLITSRFPLAILDERGSAYYYPVAVEEIDESAAIALLAQRGVRGTDEQRRVIARDCGLRALTVDLAGGWINEFGGGDPTTKLELTHFDDESKARLAEPTNPHRRAVRLQEFRFSKIAMCYRNAFEQNDPAALSLLERISLFRLPVTADFLAEIFVDTNKQSIAGSALASLDRHQLNETLERLVAMKLIETTKSFTSQRATFDNQVSFSIHPAIREGFLAGMSAEARTDGHTAVARELSLGGLPKMFSFPSEPNQLNLLEELIHHLLEAGEIEQAWNIYNDRLGGSANLILRLADIARMHRICREFSRLYSVDVLIDSLNGKRSGIETPLHTFRQRRLAYFLADWAVCLKTQGNLLQARKCHEKFVSTWETEPLSEPLRNGWLAGGKQNLAHIDLSLGRLLSVLNHAREGLHLFQDSSPYFAHGSALTGDVVGALRAFDYALKQQRAFEQEPERPLWDLRGIYLACLYVKLGRFGKAEDLLRTNIAIIAANGIQDDTRVFQSRILLSELAWLRGNGGLAEEQLQNARDWAARRDARELRCLSSLVQACIEFSKLVGQPSGGDERRPVVPRASFVASCSNALRDGLQIARDCGFGLLHIDLLLARARLHLLSGEPQAALDDLRTALDDGIPANEQTGQPELIAATHPECGYAWAIAEGLQLRGEALLLQAAQELQSATIVDRTMIEAAEAKLKTLWGVEQELAHAVKCRESHEHSHATIESMVLGRREMALNALRQIPAAVAKHVDMTFHEMSILLSRELNGHNVAHRHPEYLAKLGELQTSIDSLRDWKSLITTSRASTVERLIVQARNDLESALARWQPLYDPEPERPDQNFQLDGNPYNYRAAETHRILTALDNGVLTRLAIRGQRTVNSPKPPIGVQLARERILAEKRRSELSDIARERAQQLEDAWNKLRSFSRAIFHQQTGLDPKWSALLQPPAPAEYWLAKADLVVAIGQYINADPYWPSLLKSLDRGDEWKQTALDILEAGMSGQRHHIAEWLSDLPSRGTVGSHNWPGNLVGMWLAWKIREELASADRDRIFEPKADRVSINDGVSNPEKQTRGESAAVPSQIKPYSVNITSGIKSTLENMEWSMHRCKVLFLAANPLDCTSLQLDEEARAIEQRILQSNHRDAIEFLPKFAVRRDDLQLHLNKEQPHILHFSGHGSKDEIAFKGDDGHAASVSKAGLKAMLKAVKDNIRLVVLNACYTRQQADSITDVIDCAIGMKRGIGDEAARVFAASFYLAIGFGRSVQNAFDQAVAALNVMEIPEEKTPILSCRDGIDAANVFLVEGTEKSANPK